MVRPLIGLLAGLAIASSAQASDAPPLQPGTRPAIFVGNNWDGTIDVVDPDAFKRLGRLNAVPDLSERLAEITTDPVRLGYFLGIRQLIGEGHDQFVDDVFSAPDGRTVYVSRPSLADVVGIDIASGKIVWRFVMEGQRTDHMAISRDGTRLLVSDSTANKVHVLDPREGKKVGEFPSGDSPHESNFSRDGSRIFHASIGLVYTPADQPVLDSTKGDRWFQEVDARTLEVRKRVDIGEIMAAHGYPDMSAAVRPMAISPDEKTAYLQLSFLHGFVEFDLETYTPRRVVSLPLSVEAQNTPRELYLLDSAHHGLAVNPTGEKLCVAGTMSDYAAIVHTQRSSIKTFAVGRKPYWSTNSADGKHCFVSSSGDDQVVVLDYESEREVARIPVGDHPQRIRNGAVSEAIVGALSRSPSVVASRRAAALSVTGARVVRGMLELRVRMTARATGPLSVTYRAQGRRASFRVPVPRDGVVRRRLPAALRDARNGLVEVVYRGDAGVRPARASLRAGTAGAGLRRTAARVDDRNFLVVAGRVSRRARGHVTVALAYRGDGNRVRTLRFRAPVRHGRWALRRLLPSKAASDGGQLTIRYAGDARRHVRGAQLSSRLRP